MLARDLGADAVDDVADVVAVEADNPRVRLLQGEGDGLLAGLGVSVVVEDADDLVAHGVVVGRPDDALGVAALEIDVDVDRALGDGLVSMMTGLAGGLQAHLVGSETDASVDLSKIDEGAVRRIAALPGVETAEGFLTGYTSLGDLPFFVVFGYQPRGALIRGLRIVEGSPLTTNRQALLGRVAAENLDKRVGQAIQLMNSRYKIVGIYESGVPFVKN